MGNRGIAIQVPDRFTLVAFCAIVVLLGVNFVAIRFSNRELQPFWGAALRFGVASALLFTLIGLKKIPLPRGSALVGASLFGILAFAANFGLLYWALLRVPSGMASVVFSLIPLLTVLFAILLRLERFRWRGLLGALMALAGAGVVFSEKLEADIPLVFLLAVLGAAVCAALSGIVVKWFPKSHPVSTNAVAMAVGTTLLFAVSRIAGEAVRVPVFTATWLALAWLIVSSVVAFVLMVWVITRWTASAAAYTAVLSPLVTVAVAAWLASETVTLTFLIGSGFVLAGVYIGALRLSQWSSAPVSKPAAS